MDRVRGCVRCESDSESTVVIGFLVVQTYLDLCGAHLEELLDGARPLGPRPETTNQPEASFDS
jgi:hypothetical protein